MEFKNKWTNVPKVKGAGNFDPDQTVPDMSMEISDILKRFRAGQTSVVKIYDQYSEEDETEPEYELKDLTDLDEARQALNKIKDKVSKSKELKSKALKKGINDKNPDGINPEDSEKTPEGVESEDEMEELPF